MFYIKNIHNIILYIIYILNVLYKNKINYINNKYLFYIINK